MNPETNSPPTAADRTTRQKIITAALDEFANHGKEGARVDRIARNAGVNKAMIYYHFDSKDALYLEVVTSFFDHSKREARKTVLPQDNLEDALAALARLHAEAFLENPRFAPLILRELANPQPEVIDAIADIFNSAGISQKIVTLLNDGMNDGRYRRLDLRQTLLAFASMSFGYYLTAPMADRFLKIDDRQQFVAERRRVIVDLFLNGLKAR